MITLDEFGKRLGAKAIKITDSPKKESATMPTRTNEQWMKEINQMLAGEKTPPNQFAAYLVDQIRSIQAEGSMLEKEVNQRTQQLEQMRLKVMQMQAVMQQYIEDLKKWAVEEKEAKEIFEKEMHKQVLNKANALLEKEVKHEGVAKPILGRT